MSINIRKAYRTVNRLDQKRKFPCHIKNKTLSIQKKVRILKG